MRRLQRHGSRLASIGLGGALLAGVLAAGAAPALADHALQLGPRSLYPATNRLRSSSEIPLVIRDAIENIANRTRLLAVGPRIMGGEPAAPGAFPWMASLELKLRRKDSHFCGGAFIAPQWVMTAAHCVKPDSAGAVDVLGGTNTLDTGGALYPVDRVIVHEKYDTDTQDYDVALLHLSKAFPGKTVRLLKPAVAGRYAPVGGFAISAGWGLTAEGREVSNILRQVTVQVVSNKACNGLAAYAGAVTDHMLCAGFPEGGKDSCQGDSGGPLMVSDGEGGYFQAGVVSWGEGCGRPNKFGVYTRVSAIADWVAQKTGSKSAPTASNAASKTARTAPAKTAPAKTEPAKTEPAKTEPVKAASANAEPAKSRAARPERFDNTPLIMGPPRPTAEETPATATTSLTPLPRPRPSALKARTQSPRLRSERRLGVPVDRKYAPSYPARAQSRRYHEKPPNAPATSRKRPRGFYMPPDRGRIDIPPSFDWRVKR